MTLTKQVMVCLRCERQFPDLSIINPPSTCPNCGKDGYWAIQTATYGVIEIGERKPAEEINGEL